MDKIQLNYNEYLKYIFAGGFGILCYFFLQPQAYSELFNNNGDFKDSLFLLFVSLILGSFLYSVHRALLFPICLRINFIILTIFKKINTTKNTNSWDLFTGHHLIMKEDFRRWNQRDNPESFAKHLLDWSAQIHFLYCCVWAMVSAKIFIFQEVVLHNFLIDNWLFFASVLFLISLRNHYRFLLYDLSVDSKDLYFKKEDLKGKNEE